MKIKIGKIKIMSKSYKDQKRKLYYTPGNIRLGLGMYRTHDESQKHIEKSLKRKLP